MTTTALPAEPGTDQVSGSNPPDFSSVMVKLLTAWIVIVAVLSFVTAPWLAPGNNGDLTAPLIWFYHALMLPAALLFLILCTRVFVLHPWVRYIVTHSALVAIFEGIGFLILGYGTLHNVASLTTFGFWVILPATLELTAATLLFVIDLAYAALVPPRGQPVPPQKAEITWVFFFTGVSVITWVVFGLAAAASQVGISWSFWAGAQHEFDLHSHRQHCHLPFPWDAALVHGRNSDPGGRGIRLFEVDGRAQAGRPDRRRYHARRHRSLLWHLHHLRNRHLFHSRLVPFRSRRRQRDRHG